MPIYEYACRACGRETEKLQKLSDAPLTDCPACGKPELVRKISAAGFRLKGAGWYETDFKKDGKKNLSGESKPESKPESGTSKEAKAGDKPAAPSTESNSKPTKPSSDGSVNAA